MTVLNLGLVSECYLEAESEGEQRVLAPSNKTKQ